MKVLISDSVDRLVARRCIGGRNFFVCSDWDELDQRVGGNKALAAKALTYFAEYRNALRSAENLLELVVVHGVKHCPDLMPAEFAATFTELSDPTV